MKKVIIGLVFGIFGFAGLGLATGLIVWDSGSQLGGGALNRGGRVSCTASTSTLPKTECTVTGYNEYQARRDAVACCQSKGGGNMCSWVTCRHL